MIISFLKFKIVCSQYGFHKFGQGKHSKIFTCNWYSNDPYSLNRVSKVRNKDIWKLRKVSYNLYIYDISFLQILIKSIPECISLCLSKFVCYSETDLRLNSHVLKSFMPIVDHYLAHRDHYLAHRDHYLRRDWWVVCP